MFVGSYYHFWLEVTHQNGNSERNGCLTYPKSLCPEVSLTATNLQGTDEDFIVGRSGVSFVLSSFPYIIIDVEVTISFHNI